MAAPTYFWGGHKHTVPQPKPFKPFVPPSRPPAGLYDPGLDSQLAAAQRGYGYTTQDTETQGTRASTDYATSAARLAQQRDQSLGDIVLSYKNLAASQADRANAAGVLGSSGYDQGAQQVRDVNQNRETGRVNDAYATSLADLSLGYGRGGEDRATAQSRAGSELGFFNTDTAVARNQQAQQAGWVPQVRRPGENTKNGVTYRRLGDGRAQLASTGRTVSAARLRQILARGH